VKQATCVNVSHAPICS